MAIPKPKVFWPLTISTTNQRVYVRVGATDYTANIAAGTYLSAANLATAVEAALNLLAIGLWTVTVSADGLFTISYAAPFTLRFGTFVASSAYQVLGFFAVDKASSGNSVTADHQHANGWYSPVAIRKDSGPIPEQEASVVTVAMGGQSIAHDENELERRALLFDYLPPERVYVSEEGSGANVNRAIERWWRTGRAKFRYWPDGSVEGTSADYFLDLDTLKRFEPERHERKAIYAVGLKLRRYVA